ncbi:MAG: hypothetical protein Q7R95_11025 [bacterium]|nr:hypothetical protein [bacterium]
MNTSITPTYTENELKQIVQNFFIELQNASSGKTHHIPFLIHNLPQKRILPENSTFQVMVIGGTVFKSAIINKSGTNLTIISQNESQIPNFINDEVFLSFVYSHLDPLVNFLSINFAFPLSPIVTHELLDGVLIQGTKEHTFFNLVGKPIGKTIEKYVLSNHHKSINVTVANDTICLLLAHLEKNTWNNTIGGIIGTGTNYSLTLDNNKLVNLESGNFDNFPQTETGKIIDAQSINPKKALFEKEISGAYLFKHFNIICNNKNLLLTPLSDSSQLSEIAKNKSGILKNIAINLLQRSASLAACQIAGIVLFKKTLGIERITLIMEGNLFWKGYRYKTMLEHYLKLLNVYDSIQFSPIRHSSIQGAIRLLLSIDFM